MVYQYGNSFSICCTLRLFEIKIIFLKRIDLGFVIVMFSDDA